MNRTLLLTAIFACYLLLYWIAPHALLAGFFPVLALPFIEALNRANGPDHIFIAFMALIVGYTVAVSHSPDMDRSVLVVMWIFMAQYAFYVFRVLAGEGRDEMLQALMAASGLLVLVNALAFLRDGLPLPWQLGFDTNNAHALFNMLFLIALATGQFKQRWAWLWLAGYAFIALFSNARASWLGLAAGIATLAGLDYDRFRDLARRHDRLIWWGAAALCIAGLAVIYWQTFLVGQGRREELWGVGWRMFLANPILGSGPDTYQAAFVRAYPALAPYNHPHNQLLMWLDDAGLIGAAAGLWLTAALARALWQRRADPWARGALAAGASLAAASLFDTPTTSAYVTATFLAIAAAGLHLPCSSTTTSEAALRPGVDLTR